MPRQTPLPVWLILLLSSMLAAPISGAAGGAISERTYQRLARVHDLMEAQRYDAALKILDGIPSSDAKTYEKALIQQTYGYLYAGREQYRRAAEAFAQCLALAALPRSATQSVRYALAQLQLALGDDADAVTSIEQWLKAEQKPKPEAYALAAVAFAQVGRYQEAIEYLNKAISSVDSPREIWFQQLLAVYYATERYPAAAKLLVQLIRGFPDRKNYWLQLSGIYQTLKDDAKALAVMDLAYRKGLAFTESELLNLIRYYLFMDLPYKAAVTLEHALRERRVSSSARNLVLLSDAWLQAKEISRALDALAQALARTPAPDLRLREAQLAVQIDDWPRVLAATRKIQTAGQGELRGQALLLQGMAHFYLYQHEAALQAFETAKSFPQVRERAATWADYAAQEMALNERMADVRSPASSGPSSTTGAEN